MNQLVSANDILSRLDKFDAARPTSGGGQGDYIRLTKQGEWIYGRDETEVEEGSKWAVNIHSMAEGFQCWPDDAQAPVGEVLARVFEDDPINPGNLPNHGTPWNPMVAFELMCVDGEDAGQVCVYKSSAKGARAAFNELFHSVRAHLRDNFEDFAAKSPIISLEHGWWKTKFGKVAHPIFVEHGWQAPTTGAAALPEPEPEPEPEPVPEPPKTTRRRRRG